MSDDTLRDSREERFIRRMSDEERAKYDYNSRAGIYELKKEYQESHNIDSTYSSYPRTSQKPSNTSLETSLWQKVSHYFGIIIVMLVYGGIGSFLTYYVTHRMFGFDFLWSIFLAGVVALAIIWKIIEDVF